ncbi:hypothetical protein HMPREF1982_04189 [Clostridiales bacterium oral taxon 876 str. F0540]|nr:hypothetical protein HMPREF1982_04189 [Clostridiales bacterium oral taxon 876 str. F0540]
MGAAAGDPGWGEIPMTVTDQGRSELTALRSQSAPAPGSSVE